MGTCAHAAAAGIFGVLGMASLGATQAAEVTVLTGQGVVSAVRDLAPAFERASGHKVDQLRVRAGADAQDRRQRAGGPGDADPRGD
jgi:isopentenyl diphosphate isomerase/L-lactate dehydrogenase-like FMN-dependent dehydrogenase